MIRRKERKAAVALTYRPESSPAPVIAAKGRGKIAEKLIEIAKAHGIFVHSDPDLIEVLSRLDLNEEIPPDIYVVVAELLAFVYSLNSGKIIR